MQVSHLLPTYHLQSEGLFLEILENQIVKTLFQGFDLREVGMDNLVKLLKDRVEVLARYFQ